ncbi:hypothetical protein BT69DRAFT_164764 [Atractiella rhizophila]|nr:hypothetical protein BT69DRAFT_164764 [Atractiella rhizophila]
MATNFIGSIISLISKSDIRYRGVLHSIDPNEATVSLSGVRSMGTEGRKGGGEGEVEPGDQIYEFIVFRASDVKDLKIEQPSGAGASGAEDAKKGIAERDPAIVGVGVGRGEDRWTRFARECDAISLGNVGRGMGLTRAE